MSKKDTIVIAHGHLYLFWTTGVYYTRELLERYNVVLLVPKEYRNSERFLNFCSNSGIKYIYYYGFLKGNLITRSFSNSALFQKIILLHSPVCVVQHDYILADNMYLFHWAKRLTEKCQNIVILSSQPSSKPILKTFAQIREELIAEYSHKYYLPKWTIAKLTAVRRWIYSYLNNRLLPILILRESPYFPVSNWNNVDILPTKPLFDYFLVYDTCERDYLEELFQTTGPFQIIKSPISDPYKINSSLYNIMENQQVVFFPSLIALGRISSEKPVLIKWVEALNILREKYPKHRFLMKFHPGAKDKYILPVKSYFSKQCSFLSFAPKTDGAEELMVNSQVVVGDASTTLWWARAEGSKTVISLDFENHGISNSMAAYKSIFYFKNLNGLSKFDATKETNEIQKEVRPTLLEFINKSSKG